MLSDIINITLDSQIFLGTLATFPQYLDSLRIMYILLPAVFSPSLFSWMGLDSSVYIDNFPLESLSSISPVFFLIGLRSVSGRKL